VLGPRREAPLEAHLPVRGGSPGPSLECQIVPSTS
jgi:hypothetical protein